MSNPVVTNQPGAGGYGTNVQTGEWSTGLCSCFSDCLICECNQIIYLCPMHMVYKSEKYIILSVKLSQYVFSGAFGCLCPIGLSCYTANKYGENCCLGCVPGGMTAMRTHMRLTYGIQVQNQSIPLMWWKGDFLQLDLMKCRDFTNKRNTVLSLRLWELNLHAFLHSSSLLWILLVII